MWTAVTNRLFRLTMFWGGTLPLPYDPAYDASSWRWRIKSEANTSCHLCTSGGGGEEWCEASHQPAGVERGGDRQRALPLPLQHRPLPGRQTHHIRSGTSWVSNLNLIVWIRATVWLFLPRREARPMQWLLEQAWSTPVYLLLWSPPSVHTPYHSGIRCWTPVSLLWFPPPRTWICRPIVVPAGVELKISVSPDSRNTAWVSFDGRKRQELCHGDSLRVTTSIYPIPSICAQVRKNWDSEIFSCFCNAIFSQDQITDWFDSLAECLHWNVRIFFSFIALFSLIFVAWNRVHCASFQVRKKQRTLDELSDLSSDPYAALEKVQFLFLQPTLL